MDLKENEPRFYHFTKTENLDSIFERGLDAKIGDNAKGVEHSKKVFFVEGRENVLKLVDSWIRWFIVRYQRVAYVKEAVEGIDPKESPLADMIYRQQEKWALAKHHKDVESGAVETEEAKMAAFKKMYKDWKNTSYLALDLKEGKDFSYDDIDDAKEWNVKNRDNLKYLEYMYGKIDKVDGLEKWNLHTFAGVGVSPKKIEQVSVGDKTDGISIVQYMYEQEKKSNPEFNMPLLDEFMENVKKIEAGKVDDIKKVQTNSYLENAGPYGYLINQDN